MTLWRIRDGVPSIADALLTLGGPLSACSGAISCIDPLLDFFEPRGLGYLGFAIALLLLLVSGGAAAWLFFRNEKKLRWEVIVPRRVFLISAVPVTMLGLLLTSSWAWGAGLRFFEHFALLVVCLLPIFGVVMRYSLRSPHRAMAIAVWFHLALVALGTLAKVASLVMRR